MILGMTPLLFVHVAISLIAIAAGLVVLSALLKGTLARGWTGAFLATTVATSVTGFLFPFNGFTPALGVGVISMIILAAAIAARYAFHLAGAWRGVYVVTAITALYLNVFVLVVQAFQKVAALNALAPTGSEPPFAAAQGVVLLLFIIAGVFSFRRFQPGIVSA